MSLLLKMPYDTRFSSKFGSWSLKFLKQSCKLLVWRQNTNWRIFFPSHVIKILLVLNIFSVNESELCIFTTLFNISSSDVAICVGYVQAVVHKGFRVKHPERLLTRWCV
jgi:fatty-acid desaturase